MPGGQWINRYRDRHRHRLVIGKTRGPGAPQSEKAGRTRTTFRCDSASFRIDSTMSRDAAQARKTWHSDEPRLGDEHSFCLVAAETPLSLRARIISLTAAHFRASEEGNPSWRFRAQAKRKHQRLLPRQAPLRLSIWRQGWPRIINSPSARGEAILGDLVESDHQASQERRAGPDFGLWHLAGPLARSPHGPQSGDRRGHQDQSEQESGIPAGQGFKARDIRLTGRSRERFAPSAPLAGPSMTRPPRSHEGRGLPRQDISRDGHERQRRRGRQPLSVTHIRAGGARVLGLEL